MARRRSSDPEPCPDCGEELSLGNTICKECGWDADLAAAEAAGAGDEAELAPDDYDDFLVREGLADRPPPRGKELLWLVTAVITLIGFVYVVVLWRS